jgi:FXSXX-COOH protein
LKAISVSNGAAEPGWAPLVDVSGTPLTRLRRGDATVLDRSLDRLIRSLDDPHGVISAFGSFISDS